MSIPNDVSRRTFLMTSAAALAVVGAPAALARSAGETLNIGCIGTGGRCQTLMKSLVKVPNVRIAAVCDIYDAHLAAARKIADPKAVAVKVYKEILDNKDIDAVLIGAPDHWHVPMTVDALAAGKDVYVEKPLTHKLEEGKIILEAQNKSKQIVQVGMQQRSMPHIAKARDLIKEGRIGKVCKVHLTWNRNSDRVQKTPLNIDPKTMDWKAFLGNAPAQPFDEYRFRNWRWFWNFGGGILTDLMVHQIDIAHWFLGLDHPETATTIGDSFKAQGVWETPDTVQTLLGYPDKQVQAYFEGTFVNARNAAMIEFMGSEATLYLDRGRYEVHPERNKKIVASELVLGSGPRGADFYALPKGEVLHLSNWLECIRSRRKPNCPAETGVSAAAAAHLGNLALRSGQVAHWKT